MSVAAGLKAYIDSQLLQREPVINGVQHFYRNTKPTTRVNNSALAEGDTWWKISEGTQWEWNGTYWLSPRQLLAINSTNRNVGSTPWSADHRIIPPADTSRIVGFFLHSVSCFFQLGVNDGSNHWDFTLGLAVNNGNAATSLLTVNTASYGTVATWIHQPLNQYFANTAAGAKKFSFQTGTRTGSPANLTVDGLLEFSLVHA